LSTTGKAVGPEISLGTLTLEGRRTIFTVPQIQTPMGARLGDSIAFLGYDLSPAVVSPGKSLYLTLYWQALGKMDVSYTVFTHLLDTKEQIRGQKDSVPGGGTLPTTSWMQGEIITDEYEIAVYPDAPPGEYVIEMGMYDASTGQRLPVFSDDQVLEDDRLLLGVVQVVP